MRRIEAAALAALLAAGPATAGPLPSVPAPIAAIMAEAEVTGHSRAWTAPNSSLVLVVTEGLSHLPEGHGQIRVFRIRPCKRGDSRLLPCGPDGIRIRHIYGITVEAPVADLRFDDKGIAAVYTHPVVVADHLHLVALGLIREAVPQTEVRLNLGFAGDTPHDPPVGF